MPPVGFESPISAAKRPQTYAFDRAAIDTGVEGNLSENLKKTAFFMSSLTQQITGKR
jgi:hypothetical protein